MTDVTAILTSPLLLVSLVGLSMALIFFISDRNGPTTRAFALWLLAVSGAAGVATFDGFGGQKTTATGNLLLNAFEVLAILAGIEWGRRIGQTVPGRLRTVTNWLFRFSQLFVLTYGLLAVGYMWLFPELALNSPDGLIRVRPVEFAVFAPIIGVSMLLAALAIIILRFMRIDRAELARLNALFIAAPFLLMGLIFAETWVAVPLMLGLLIALAGAIRHLMIQSKRGAFMQQFLSPQIARIVRQQGLDSVLKRERIVLSVVMCDLRGFTAYARRRDSDTVTSLLERYYAVVGEIAAQYSGTVKDHAGDGVLILVGAPLPLPDHAERAARLALALHEPVRTLLATADAALGLGVGVATGHATVGAIRGAGRLEYVAVGNPVNLAARLCARALDGEVLADVRTCRGIGAQMPVSIEERPPEPLKGFAEPIPVRAITANSGTEALGH